MDSITTECPKCIESQLLVERTEGQREVIDPNTCGIIISKPYKDVLRVFCPLCDFSIMYGELLSTSAGDISRKHAIYIGEAEMLKAIIERVIYCLCKSGDFQEED